MDDGPAPTPSRAPLPPEDLPPERGGFTVPLGLLWALALAVVVLTIASWVAFSAENERGGRAADGGSALDPAAAAAHPEHTSELELTGQPVPAATFTTFEGATASLADYRGTPLVVNFWSSTCPPCIKEMPDIERVHQAYGDRVKVVGVAVADGENNARALARVTKVTYQLGLDTTGAVAKAFGLVNLPATVLVAPDGTVVHTAPARALTAEQLTALIEEHLHP